MSIQKGASSSKKAPNTLSSIVSNLVRSAIGGGNKHDHVEDEDLDKYVADMIMMNAAESRAKYEKYGLTGSKTAGSLNPNGADVGSSSSNDKIKLASGVVIDRADSNGLKTNKRFLSSIIKHTDSHNQALIQSEEKRAAEAAKELIADLDRRAADRERQSGGRKLNTERMYREKDWRHPDRSSSSSKSSKLSLSSRSKALNSSPSQSGRMRMDEVGADQNLFGRSGGDLKADSDTWKKTPLSPDSRSESESESGSSASPQSDSIARSRSSRSRPRSRSPEEDGSKSKSRDQHSSRGRDRSKDGSSLKKTELEPSSSSGSILGSRMDKYFQQGYDPLLDVHDEDEGNRNTSRTSKSSKKSKKRKSSRKEEKSKRSSEDRHKSKRHHRHRSESPGSEDDKEDERQESKRRRHKSRRRNATDSEDEREEDKNRKSSSSRSSRTHRKSRRRDSDSDADSREEGDRKGSSSRSSRSSHKRSRKDSDTEDEDSNRKASSEKEAKNESTGIWIRK